MSEQKQLTSKLTNFTFLVFNTENTIGYIIGN